MKVRKIPMRKCVGCGELHPKKELIRIVALPTGEIEVDRTGKQSGRGVYICDKEECFKKRPVSREVYEALQESLSHHE